MKNLVSKLPDIVRESLKMSSAVFALIVCVIAFLIFPIAWFQGHARSEYLKQSQGIEMKWYYAAFIDVKAGKINAEVNLQSKPPEKNQKPNRKP